MAIRVDPKSRRGRFALQAAATLARLLIGGIGRTCRFEVAEGADRVDDLLGRGDGASGAEAPVILCFWHERAILGAHIFRRHLVAHGLDATVMISQSRDGELVSNLARQWGFKHARGSASRGGSAALRALYRAIRKGSSPVLIPDGPRGPAHRFKTGVAVLSQISGRPILPMAFAANRSWRIRSWDRLFIPKPFSRVALTVGAPYRVPKDLDEDGLERVRLEIESRLVETTAAADRAAARPAEAGSGTGGSKAL